MVFYRWGWVPVGQSAYITMVQGSAAAEVSLDGVKEQLRQYREQMALTGRQLGWDYAEAAFPYEIKDKPEANGRWFYLKGTGPLYRHIVIGTGERTQDETASVPFIQVVLPDDATHGDKAKANELCKWIGNRLKAEVQLFNGRTIYYNPRK